MSRQLRKDSLTEGKTKVSFVIPFQGKPSTRTGVVMDKLSIQFTITSGDEVFFRFYDDRDWKVIDEYKLDTTDA